MEYLNIPVSVLDSPEYVGADQVERGTWLCLMRYCVGQENSGVIADCANWKDRQWQQLCRSTRREVTRKARLWQWAGNSLRVFYYPQEAQEKVIAKRLVAQKNGQAGGRPTKNPEQTQEQPKLVIFEKAEGKEKEGNGIERDPVESSSDSLCSLEQAINYAPTVRFTPEQAAHWWHVRNASGWTRGSAGGGTSKIGSWQSDMATSLSWVGESLSKSASIKTGTGGAAAETTLKDWEK